MRRTTHALIGAAAATTVILVLQQQGIDIFLGAGAAVATGVALSAVASRLRGRAPAARTIAAAAVPPPEPAAEALPVGVGRALLDLLPLGLLLLDREGRIVYANPAVEDMMERSLVGLAGASALRAPALSEAITAALREGRSAEIDVTVQRSRERSIHGYIQPLPERMTARGPRPTVLILLEDRTSQTKAEALRRDFVANASHELKTPLASISGFIETLQGHAREDPEAAERFLAIMASQAERMKRLVEDLISLNRIEMNEHVLPRDPVDVAAAVWEVAGALEPVAATAGAEVRVDLPESGLIVRGDATEIGQVFVNLIENAVKYAGRDGPIRVYREPESRARPTMVGVTVADQGPGIAREHLPRLTERFYRVDVARSRERGGTGLGLAIAKHILNRHRGDLTVASAPGEGARFTVWLPAQQQGAGAPGADDQAA